MLINEPWAHNLPDSKKWVMQQTLYPLLQCMTLHSVITRGPIFGNSYNMTEYIESEVLLSRKCFHAWYMGIRILIK